MAVRFFEDGVDYKKYIDERLLEVQEIEDRQQLREIVANMLIPFYERIEEQYRRIEERVYEANDALQGNYKIITGIQPRNKIDITDTSMFPMRKEDLEETQVQVEDLWSALEQQKEHKIYSVFFQADYTKIKELENCKRVFHATVKTEWGEYPATVRLKKNQEYLNQVKALYQEFLNNGIAWKTVCSPYLYKIFDVLLVSAQLPKEERIEEIEVSFEEFEPYVRYHYVPLWNIKKVTVKTSAYPTFCQDKIHYEHCIYGTRLQAGNDYLVEGKKQLWNVYRKDGDLYIQCDEKMATDWELKEFCYESGMKNYELPLIDNKISVPNRGIRTIAEVKKYVNEMTGGMFIQLQDVNRNPHHQADETYDCDAFIVDEIRNKKDAQTLYFEFAPLDEESFLTRDMMSYVVSQLQMIYPEYHCKGVLI